MQPAIESSVPFFASARRKPVATSAGPCELPILYADASLLTLVYSVAPELARAHVDPRGFEPWVVFGKAWMALCAFEYRETTIGPYRELGLGLLVKRAGTSPSLVALARDQRKVTAAGLFVTNLPVTTANARAAGFELWGFPKYVTGIETSFREDGVRVVLEGELEITMKRGFHVKTSGLPLCLFSVHEEKRVLRTVVETESTVEWGGAGSVEVKVLGDGPTAKTMQALGIHARKPALAYVTDHMKAILPAGEDAGKLER
jgi:Acetoacetate decarboxylase (ADC)